MGDHLDISGVFETTEFEIAKSACITIVVKQVYLYISQFSGERLQDHWSSGY